MHLIDRQRVGGDAFGSAKRLELVGFSRCAVHSARWTARMVLLGVQKGDSTKQAGVVREG